MNQLPLPPLFLALNNLLSHILLKGKIKSLLCPVFISDLWLPLVKSEQTFHDRDKTIDCYPSVSIKYAERKGYQEIFHYLEFLE